MSFQLNRTNDAVFKAVFAKHPRITLALINAFFEFQGTELISDIEFIDRELDGDLPMDKESRLDILGKTSTGEKVNIEMQVNSFDSMAERALFYWARNYVTLQKGEDYDSLTRTVSINILGFNIFDEATYPNMHSYFGLYDQSTGCQLTKLLEIHFLELKKVKSGSPKALTRMEKWAAYFSRTTPEEKLREIAASEPAIQEALEVESVFTQDEIARRHYEKAEKFRRDQRAMLSFARKEGMAQGIEKGTIKGRLEAAREMAVSMLALGKLTVEEIAAVARLSPDEVRALATK